MAQNDEPFRALVAPGELTIDLINQPLKKISEAITALYGRGGPLEIRNSLSLFSGERSTFIDFDNGVGGAASISMTPGSEVLQEEGFDTVNLAIGKGAVRNEEVAGQNGWIAKDTTASILFFDRTGFTFNYNNASGDGLIADAEFAPSPLFTIDGEDGTFDFCGDLLPCADDIYDLGSSALAWKDLHLDGSLATDLIVAHTASGTISLAPDAGAGSLGVLVSGSGIVSNGTYATGDPPGAIGLITNPFSSIYGSEWSLQNGGSGLVGGTNYERLRAYQSTDFFLLQESGGTGTIREFNIGTAGASALTIQTTGIDRWSFSSAGHLVPAADDTYDIGTTSAGVSQIFINDGALANPALAFSDDPDCGLMRSAADWIDFTVGGKKTLTIREIDAANFNGYEMWDNKTEGYMFAQLVGTGAGNYLNLQYANSTRAGIFYVRNNTASDLRLGTSGADRWVIDSAGDMAPETDNTFDIGSDAKEVAQIWAYPMAAVFKANSEDGSSNPVWDNVVLNTNTSMFTVESSDTQIHVNNSGYYKITSHFTYTVNAASAVNVTLQRNGATQDSIYVLYNGHASSGATISGTISQIVYCSGTTDYFKIIRDAGAFPTNDVYHDFCIERLN